MNPSTSLELVPLKVSLKCQICDKPAHGCHHGALTCRACCAFFRRAGGTRHLWKCKAQNNCDVSGKRYYCKKCRLDKCFRIGMTAEKFQLDRDAISNTLQADSGKSLELPTSLEKFLGRPHIVIRCEPRSSEMQKTFIDLSYLIDKGSNILSKNYKFPSETKSLNCVEKLAINLKSMRQMKPHGEIVYRKIGRKESFMFWELDFCRTAEWLAHFDEFRKLPISLKMKFLKSIWSIWAILEKSALCASSHSKNEEISHEIVPLDDSASIDMKNLEVDISWCTDYEPDKLGYFLNVYDECIQLSGITKILIDLQATDVEVNFMILQICFRYAGRRHQGELLETSEKLLEIVSNQMHDYYSNVLKMPNYSGRIAKLMKCDYFIQEFVKSRNQKIEIAHIFDIFNVQYSHPEMFIDSPLMS